jgi:hypothetical protein
MVPVRRESDPADIHTCVRTNAGKGAEVDDVVIALLASGTTGTPDAMVGVLFVSQTADDQFR